MIISSSSLNSTSDEEYLPPCWLILNYYKPIRYAGQIHHQKSNLFNIDIYHYRIIIGFRLSLPYRSFLRWLRFQSDPRLCCHLGIRLCPNREADLWANLRDKLCGFSTRRCPRLWSRHRGRHCCMCHELFLVCIDRSSCSTRIFLRITTLLLWACPAHASCRFWTILHRSCHRST